MLTYVAVCIKVHLYKKWQILPELHVWNHLQSSGSFHIVIDYTPNNKVCSYPSQCTADNGGKGITTFQALHGSPYRPQTFQDTCYLYMYKYLHHPSLDIKCKILIVAHDNDSTRCYNKDTMEYIMFSLWSRWNSQYNNDQSNYSCLSYTSPSSSSTAWCIGANNSPCHFKVLQCLSQK